LFSMMAAGPGGKLPEGTDADWQESANPAMTAIHPMPNIRPNR
jgi:hypothetical protein